MRFRLLHAGKERRLSPGNFLIGRSPDCAIVVDDPLVSRHHAVLRVSDTEVHVEDLGSRNGVYVNGSPIKDVTQLQDGDELSVSDCKLVLVFGDRKAGFSTTAPEGAKTRPAEMFGVLGSLADKALAMGRAQEAERLLGTHLDNLLKEVRQGFRPEDQVQEQAIRYAARLAAATRRGYWFSFVFEMLVELERSCPAPVLDDLYSAAGKADNTDLKPIRDYIGAHRAQANTMAPRERFLLNRVEGLERLLSP